MVRLQSKLAAALGLAATLVQSTPIFDDLSISPRGVSPYYDPREVFPKTSCPIDGSISCRNTTAQENHCCFESPGGLVLLTQFWDVNPPIGPNNTWTIHGLWADRCDGSFDEKYCDENRRYPNPTELLQNAGRTDLIDYMTINWVNSSGGTNDFWKHEWDHHGACFSTLKPDCLPPGSPTGTEAVLYFDRTVELFKKYTTYQYLENAGIVPNDTATYQYTDMQNAFKNSTFGHSVTLNCSKGNVEIFYWFHLKGSVVDGELIPVDPPVGKEGTCKDITTGINYNNKGFKRPSGPPPPPPMLTKSFIRPLVDGALKGVMLSGGTWSVLTAAGYTAEGSGDGFTLRTGKGPCGVGGPTGTAFSCGTGVAPSVFSVVTADDGKLLLALGKETNWSAAAVPSGSKQEPVTLGSSGAVDFRLVITNPA